MNKKKLVLIDSNALVHRAFHALPPLSSQSGELTNAVYGFTSILFKVINEIKPDYLVACFDLPKPTFRHKEFEEYKAHRAKTPEDLVPQFAKVKEVLRAFEIPIFEKEGFEADDLLGTISLLVKNGHPDIQTIILTGDLDTLQLVDDKNTIVYTLKKGITDVVIYDEKAVMDRYGLKPDQMIDFKGLKGDPSDNIPGVPGFGDKTTTNILLEYGTLENIYENIGVIPKKLSDKLLEYKDQAFFSKKLATIKRDVGLEFDIKKAEFGEYDKEKVIKLFRELNFFTLISRLNLKGAAEKKEDRKDLKISEIDDDLKEKLKKADFAAVSLNDQKAAFCLDESFVATASFLEAKDILEDEKIKKAGFDLKNMIKKLREDGIDMKGEYFDVMLASYLLSPGLRSYSLGKTVLQELGDDLDGEAMKGKEAFYVFLVKEKLEKKLKQADISEIFFKIEMPLLRILADMETAGIGVDARKMKELSLKLEKKIKEKEKIIYRLAGSKEFNINSPAQLGPIIFDRLKIQKEAKIKKTKTGAYATGEEELVKYKKNHKIVEEILEYRELAKLKSTYADAILSLIDEKTNRIHTTYNQAGTATGRLSSLEPNMQNIPQKGEFASDIREAFVAGEGFSFVAFDYSQIELRIIAHLSQDEKMMGVFKAGGDIHTKTAMEIMGVLEKEVTTEMRRMAKVLNFGILFGMSVKGFSEAADVDMATAKKFIEEYFLKFEKVKKFIDKTIADAKKTGYTKTELGRKRWLPDLKSQNWILRNAAERMAQNMPAQGLEADMLKLAMIKVDEEVLRKQKDEEIKMLLQVHDELVFEIKDDIIIDVAGKIRSLMEGAYKLSVPVVVDVKAGKNLSDMRSLNLS
ncbi:DNA polymerase I [Candidatus Azambacteria bacterium]|nr:DNA polymerase I [Candidatus Azambacteria bacterium]